MKALHNVRLEILTAASMKMVVSWVAAPCSLVEVYQRFRRQPSSCYIMFPSSLSSIPGAFKHVILTQFTHDVLPLQSCYEFSFHKEN
jgi:hypothetical protein